jgi:hypothetical protein
MKGGPGGVPVRVNKHYVPYPTTQPEREVLLKKWNDNGQCVCFWRDGLCTLPECTLTHEEE